MGSTNGKPPLFLSSTQKTSKKLREHYPPMHTTLTGHLKKTLKTKAV
jgi:hypothetical protein